MGHIATASTTAHCRCNDLTTFGVFTVEKPAMRRIGVDHWHAGRRRRGARPDGAAATMQSPPASTSAEASTIIFGGFRPRVRTYNALCCI